MRTSTLRAMTSITVEDLKSTCRTQPSAEYSERIRPAMPAGGTPGSICAYVSTCTFFNLLTDTVL